MEPGSVYSHAPMTQWGGINRCRVGVGGGSRVSETRLGNLLTIPLIAVLVVIVVTMRQLRNLRSRLAM